MGKLAFVSLSTHRTTSTLHALRHRFLKALWGRLWISQSFSSSVKAVNWVKITQAGSSCTSRSARWGQPVGTSVCFAHVTQIANITFSVSQTEIRGCTFKVNRWEILCCEGNFLGSLPLWPLRVPSSVTFPEPSPPEQDSEVIRHIIQ